MCRDMKESTVLVFRSALRKSSRSRCSSALPALAEKPKPTEGYRDRVSNKRKEQGGQSGSSKFPTPKKKLTSEQRKVCKYCLLDEGCSPTLLAFFRRGNPCLKVSCDMPGARSSITILRVISFFRIPASKVVRCVKWSHSVQETNLAARLARC